MNYFYCLPEFWLALKRIASSVRSQVFPISSRATLNVSLNGLTHVAYRLLTLINPLSVPYFYAVLLKTISSFLIEFFLPEERNCL